MEAEVPLPSDPEIGLSQGVSSQAESQEHAESSVPVASSQEHAESSVAVGSSQEYADHVSECSQVSADVVHSDESEPTEPPTEPSETHGQMPYVDSFPIDDQEL